METAQMTLGEKCSEAGKEHDFAKLLLIGDNHPLSGKLLTTICLACRCGALLNIGVFPAERLS